MTSLMAFVLVLRVFDRSGESAADRRVAMETADTILRQADVTPTWVDCSMGSKSSTRDACTSPLGPSELAIRITAGPRQDAPATSRPLGYSYVEPETGGTLATVFTDRVAWLAHASGARPSTLLGRAVAHEVGHLLIGTNEHSETGLMRAIWTAGELVRDERTDWMFTMADRERLHGSRIGREPWQLAEDLGAAAKGKS
jgi:hypothetical protein